MEKKYEIDVSALYNNVENELFIDEVILFNESFFLENDILDLQNVHFIGTITKNVEEELSIVGEVNGVMILEDAISLEAVEYPFSIKIDENLEENAKIYENTLDLQEFLWENIVLEVPLKFTKVTDLSKFHGDGWKLVSEDEFSKNNNPFSELLKDFGEE